MCPAGTFAALGGCASASDCLPIHVSTDTTAAAETDAATSFLALGAGGLGGFGGFGVWVWV